MSLKETIDNFTSDPPTATGREVLVVEDEARIRDMLDKALKEMGYRGSFAFSAEAGAKALASRHFDVLILDLNLPGKGGIEFLEALRRDRHDVQVIILTGFGDLAAARAAIHFDVVEFLTKPCALGALEVALDRASKRRRGQYVAERAAIEERSPTFAIDERAVPTESSTHRQDGDGGSLEDLEQKHILSVLQKHRGNRTATAAELGISIRKLYYRLGQYQKKGYVP